ncbi:twin-arginine translocase TatA/TatE family subunit, partial [Actinotalea ferrariae]|uniref:twin-arginine translocase TatA/TatE family subunit n=1 Tax=Actinotalea ferrariae TaxID=1386098 RepID=UPI00054D6B3C
MFGINGSEVLVLLLVALVVVGPERLPRYAEQLGGWVRQLRGFVKTAKVRVAEEMGEEGADVDWSQLDPRRYDPRRIVREALLEDEPPPVVGRRYTSGAARRAAAAGGATAAGA